jgi:PAT family beta-lactamase induction signal transducer AmpG
MYKNLGIDNEDIGIYESTVPPWVIKPLWSPFIDLYATKKMVLAMQLVISISTGGINDSHE